MIHVDENIIAIEQYILAQWVIIIVVYYYYDLSCRITLYNFYSREPGYASEAELGLLYLNLPGNLPGSVYLDSVIPVRIFTGVL